MGRLMSRIRVLILKIQEIQVPALSSDEDGGEAEAEDLYTLQFMGATISPQVHQMLGS
jgi:hypothetical protein